MSVNIDNLEKEFEKEAAAQAARKARTANFNIVYFNPKVGTNNIRLCPPWTSEGESAGLFARKISQHWNVGAGDGNTGFNFICPGNGCPICAAIVNLKASQDPVDRALAEAWYPKVQYYSNVIDMDDPTYTAKDIEVWKSRQNDPTRECPYVLGTTKVQVYRYGFGVYKDIRDWFLPPHKKDLTDPVNGRNIILKRVGKDKNNTRYTVTTLDPSDVSKFLDNGKLNDIDSLYLSLIKPENMMLEAIGSAPSLPTPKATVNLPMPKDDDVPFSSGSVEKPECFSDPAIHSTTDPECVGGKKGNELFDACPVFDDCAKEVQVKTTNTNSRRKPSMPQGNTSVEDLEAMLRREMAK